MAVQQVRPSRAWYWVSAALVAGAVACVVLAVLGFFALIRQIEQFQRVPVPGQGEVSFAETGDYLLFLEGPGMADASRPGLGVAELEPVDGGEPVRLSSTGFSTTYTFGGHEGHGFASFTIDRPGTYVLTVDEPTDARATGVAVGRGIGRGIVVPIVLVLGTVFVLLPAALLTGVITAVRRRRSRRRLATAPGAVGPQAVGAAWLRDPSGQHEYRYWDGVRWTGQVSDRGIPGADPL